MSRLLPRPLKVEQDFTDAGLTGFAGCSVLADFGMSLKATLIKELHGPYWGIIPTLQ